MDDGELKQLAQTAFAAAMVHASYDGETVMEDGRDEHFYQIASGPDLLRAAVSYFDSTT